MVVINSSGLSKDLYISYSGLYMLMVRNFMFHKDLEFYEGTSFRFEPPIASFMFFHFYRTLSRSKFFMHETDFHSILNSKMGYTH